MIFRVDVYQVGVRTGERNERVFPTGTFYAHSPEGVSADGRQAESLRSVARIPLELCVIIISHVMENTESPTRIHFYDNHPADRYYVK